jgi:hypothetical protein
MAKVGAPASSQTAESFWSLVLADMGAPITQQNIDALNTWSQHEGTSARFNPLATTQKESGSTNFNSVGVQNYTSAEEGAAATAHTLENGRYPGIVAAFKSGNALSLLQSAASSAIGKQLQTWSGGGYNHIGATNANYVSPAFGSGASSGAPYSAPPTASSGASTAPTTTACQTLGQSIANTTGLPGEQQVAGFFAWITQACVYKRLGIQAVSLVLILYGLKMMGHDEPLKIVQAPVGMAKAAL